MQVLIVASLLKKLIHSSLKAEKIVRKIRYEGLGKVGGSKSLELYLLQSSLHLQQKTLHVNLPQSILTSIHLL